MSDAELLSPSPSSTTTKFVPCYADGTPIKHTSNNKAHIPGHLHECDLCCTRNAKFVNVPAPPLRYRPADHRPPFDIALASHAVGCAPPPDAKRELFSRLHLPLQQQWKQLVAEIGQRVDNGRA